MTERADQVLTKTPIGMLFLTEVDGTRPWIFLGWRRNTAGHEMVFVRSIKGGDRGDPYFYHAAMADTLCKKFIGLDKYRKKTDDKATIIKAMVDSGRLVIIDCRTPEAKKS